MNNTTELNEEQNELYEHHRIVCDKRQSSIRIDKFLFARLENISRNKIQNAAKAGSIVVNDNVVKSNYKIKPGDVISIVLSYPPNENVVLGEDIPLDIVYEDNDLLIINKEAGMVVHPAHGNYTGTLLNALVHYFDVSVKEKNAAPLLVHRIDKDTSGLLLVAKNEVAQTYLAHQFFHHSISRKYHALVWGDLSEDEGTIEGNLARSPKDRRIMAVFNDAPHAKHAITHYKVLERFGYVCLVECTLETGRTHQIRAHFKHIGHPLFNDASYGGDQILKGTTFTKYKQFVQNCFKILNRQALHAKTLGFIHPGSRKEMIFDTAPPEDMQKAIEKWRHYSIHKKSDDSPA